MEELTQSLDLSIQPCGRWMQRESMRALLLCPSTRTTSEEGLEPAVAGRRMRPVGVSSASAMAGPSQAASLAGIHNSPPSLVGDAQEDAHLPLLSNCSGRSGPQTEDEEDPLGRGAAMEGGRGRRGRRGRRVGEELVSRQWGAAMEKLLSFFTVPWYSGRVGVPIKSVHPFTGVLQPFLLLTKVVVSLQFISNCQKSDQPDQAHIFCGNPAPTKQVAKEKVAQAALHQLYIHHGTVINDHNHDALRTMSISRLAAHDWSKTKEQELKMKKQKTTALQRERRRTRVLKKFFPSILNQLKLSTTISQKQTQPEDGK